MHRLGQAARKGLFRPFVVFFYRRHFFYPILFGALKLLFEARQFFYHP
jgi:hypothetical protein